MSGTYFSLLFQSWKYTDGKLRRKLVVVYSFFVSAILLGSLTPLLHGWFINELQDEENRALNAWLYAMAYLTLLSLQWVLTGPARLKESTVSFHIGKNFLTEQIYYLFQLPIEWHKAEHSGSMNSRVRKAHGSLKQFLNNGFLYLSSTIQFIISITAMVYFAPLFGVIAVILGTFAIWLNKRFDKPFIKSFNDTNDAEHKFMATLSDSLSNIFTIVTLRAGKSVEKQLSQRLQDIFLPFRKTVLINEWRWITLNFMVVLIFLVVILGYIYTRNGAGESFFIGGLVTLTGYVSQFTGSFHNIANQYTELIKFREDVQAVADIEKSYLRHLKRQPATPLPVDWKRIDISNLSFSYHAAESNDRLASATGDGHRSYPKVLNNITFKINRGERIALIGESGAGKSTLLALIRGLYAPIESSYIAVDGKKLGWRSLNESTMLFPQETEIFETTVLFNITLGLPFAKHEIRQACEITCFSEVVDQLENGFDTQIHEKGINLSGGQKQRLALTRGIMASAPHDILLLDEPTSSLDSATESCVYRNLFEKLQGKSVICSVHNLGLIGNFDYVYQMRNGVIIDEGRPEKFMRAARELM